MNHHLKKKHAVITGGGRGIGLAISKMLLKQNCQISLVGRTKSSLDKIASEFKDKRVRVYPCDLSKLEKLEDLSLKIIEDSGPADILINNAGMGSPASVENADMSSWQRMISLNLTSLMMLSHFFSQRMKDKGWGAIINIASVAGKMTFAKGAGYCASKHGVVGFSGSMFEDLRDYNIKVCAICPGYVNTDMVSARGLDPHTMIQPKDIADCVEFVLGSSIHSCPVEIVVRPQKTVCHTNI